MALNKGYLNAKTDKAAINEAIYTQVIDSEIKRNPYFTAESLALDKHNNGVFPKGHAVRTSRAYIEKILNKLDFYDKEIEEKVEKAIAVHVANYHK